MGLGDAGYNISTVYVDKEDELLYNTDQQFGFLQPGYPKGMGVLQVGSAATNFSVLDLSTTTPIPTTTALLELEDDDPLALHQTNEEVEVIGECKALERVSECAFSMADDLHCQLIVEIQPIILFQEQSGVM